MTQLLNIFDYEREALEKLEKNALDYYRSGAHDEITLGDNRAAWHRIKIHYRVLVDVSVRSMETTILGHPISMPIVVAPTAFHGLACRERSFDCRSRKGRRELRTARVETIQLATRIRICSTSRACDFASYSRRISSRPALPCFSRRSRAM